MLSIFLSYSISTPDTFYNKEPCECDVTDKCDEFCCCDKDCTPEAISNFSQHFCLKQSVRPISIISCDLNNEISKANKAKTFKIGDKVCYSYKRELTESDKIINYEESEVGLTNFSQYVPMPPIPGNLQVASTLNTFFQVVDGGNPVYMPYGIDSSICNSYILVNKDTEYNTHCVMPKATPIGDYVSPTICTSNCQQTTGDFKMQINDTAATFSYVGAPKLSFSLTTQNSDVNGRLILNTRKGGYSPGIGLTGVVNEPTGQHLTHFTFKGKKVYFDTNISVFVDKTQGVSNVDFFNANLSTTYGQVDPEVPLVNYLEIPKFTLQPNLPVSKAVIYTLMYKKFGYQSMFYYKYIGIDLQIVDSQDNYNAVELRQIELNDDATGESVPKVVRNHMPPLSSITSFMFQNENDTEATAGVITITFGIIILWLYALFVD